MDLSKIDFSELSNVLIKTLSTWGLRVLGALFLLLVGLTVAKLVKRYVAKVLEKAKLDETVVPFISSIAYYATLTFVCIAALGLFGVQTTSIVAVLGAAGFAVGLALQGTLSNFSAGVMLMIFRPFKLGDFVDLSGTSGVVKEVGIFSTQLTTPDNVLIIIPNSAVYGHTIKNYSANENRRVDLVVGISYDDDIDKAIAAVKEILANDERVLEEPESTIAVCELADSSVNLVVRPWCSTADYWPLRFALTKALKEGVEASGCSFPYPQRDVHITQNAS